jgi:hypothetical protein
MSATATLRLQPTTVPPGPGRPDRPALRVLEGGRAPSALARQAVYRRRRLVALVVALATVVAFVLLATAAVARFAGGAPSAAGGPSSTSASATSGPTVVVQPGDTLWSIAEEVAPGIDARIVVDQLIALNGGQPIVPGQELLVPA